jgi:mttA/Hcf106 family
VDAHLGSDRPDQPQLVVDPAPAGRPTSQRSVAEAGRGLGSAMRNFRQAVSAPERAERHGVKDGADEDA